MIILDKVTKSYGGLHVIPEMSCTMEEGMTHVLLGSSGCGKTTLLRMMCGLTTPDSGSVKLDERDVSLFDQRELASTMGYVIQEGGLFPHLTAQENILLPVKVLGRDFSQGLKRLEQLRNMVELPATTMEKYPAKLSGGQRQRVALLRGLILSPEVILMDEPLSALDPLVRAKLQRQLRQIFREMKKTVVLVTHDLHEASYLGDRINLISRGRILQSGKFKDLKNNPTDPFVEEFVTSQTPVEEDD